jgi:type I restriction enzyme S subunit
MEDRLTELPKGWVWTRFGEISRVMGGKRLPKGHVYSETPTNYPYIRVTDFENMNVNMENLLFLKPETQKIIQRYVISKEDIYISIAGSIGKVGLIPEKLDGANLTENAAKITSIKGVEKKFLCHYLNSTFSQQQISRLTISSNQPKLALFRIEQIIFLSLPFQNSTALLPKLRSFSPNWTLA